MIGGMIGCFKNDPVFFCTFVRGSSWMFQDCKVIKGVRKCNVDPCVKGCFKEVSRMFQESFKGVSHKFQGCFKKVSRMFL